MTEKRSRQVDTARKKKLPKLPVDDPGAEKHDVFETAKRSEIMSKVKSTKNRSTELRLRDEFKRLHITGWRRQGRVFGKPDFLFPKLRVAVFVDGCFWHGHDCRNTKPKDHAEYWRVKIERNRARDAAVDERLTKLGYLVVRIWECDFKKANAERLEEKLSPILERYLASQGELDVLDDYVEK